MRKITLIFTLVMSLFTFCGCSCEENGRFVEKEFVIKEKYDEQKSKYDYFRESYKIVTEYYFILEGYGERSVSRSEFYSYEIGDKYKISVWEEYENGKKTGSESK